MRTPTKRTFNYKDLFLDLKWSRSNKGFADLLFCCRKACSLNEHPASALPSSCTHHCGVTAQTQNWRCLGSESQTRWLLPRHSCQWCRSSGPQFKRRPQKKPHSTRSAGITWLFLYIGVRFNQIPAILGSTLETLILSNSQLQKACLMLSRGQGKILSPL